MHKLQTILYFDLHEKNVKTLSNKKFHGLKWGKKKKRKVDSSDWHESKIVFQVNASKFNPH